MMKWTTHSISTLSQTSTLSAYTDDWDTLNEQSFDQAILSGDFVGHCLKHFARGDELLVRGEDSQGVFAIGVFHKIKFGHWCTVQPSQAPLGLWLTRNNKLTHEICQGLASILPGVVVMIDLLQQDSQYIDTEVDLPLIKHFYIDTGRLTIAKNYEAYFSGLSKNLRQNINKVHNRAEKQGNRLTTKRITGVQSIAQVLRYFGEFESSGWKGKSGTAVNINNQQGRFYRDLLQHFAEHQCAECWYYCFNEQVVAVDLCIVRGRTLTILKTAYNEAFKKLSPALNLKLEIARFHGANDSKVTQIEFFGKVLDWHRRLQATSRVIAHFTWFRTIWWLRLYAVLKLHTKDKDKDKFNKKEKFNAKLTGNGQGRS
jgi:hypothetical protein